MVLAPVAVLPLRYVPYFGLGLQAEGRLPDELG